MQHVNQTLIIAEDEPLIAMMVEDIVTEFGWSIAGSAKSEAEAVELLSSCSPHLALLDINLGLTTSLAVASTCRDRHIPVVFMTGYTAGDIPSQCGDAPVLSKPFSPDDLDRALWRAMEEARV